MAEKNPVGESSFNEQFKKDGITIQQIIRGDINVQTHPKSAEISRALKLYFEKNSLDYNKMMNQAAANQILIRNETGDVKNMEIGKLGDHLKKKRQSEAIESNIRTAMNAWESATLNTSPWDSIAGPKTFRKINANQAIQSTPFPGDLNGTALSNFHGDTEQLIGYYATQKNKKWNNQGTADLNVIQEVMNSKMVANADNGDLHFQGGKIWGQVDSPVATNAYSKFSVNIQENLEKFAAFRSEINDPNSKSNGFIALDIETFGDRKSKDWFHISEVAAERFMLDPVTGKHASAEKFSWFAKPGDELKGQMQSEIDMLRKNPGRFQTLSEAKKRSLTDLMLYSTSSVESNGALGAFKPATFGQSGANLNVIHSNVKSLNELHSKGTLTDDVIMRNFNSFSAHMESGLMNMDKHGDTLEVVMSRYNGMTATHKDLFFATHNGDAFDIPGLEHFNGNKPAKHIDWLNVEKSVFTDGESMQTLYGRAEGLAYEEGANTLHEHRRTFGWDTSDGHIGAADVSERGLGGVIINTNGPIAEQIKKARNDASQDPLRRKTTELSFSEEATKAGQRFFATNAVGNYSGDYKDFQGQVIDDTMHTNGNSVLDARSFYTTLGVREMDGEKGRYALELLNEDTGVSSYIIREGDNARQQIAQFTQQHLKTADEMMEAGLESVRNMRDTDMARRRFENLLGLNQGYTKGFDATKRIFANVDVFRQNFDGALDDLTPEQRAELTGKMNFDSLYDNSFNKNEADAFWKMLPRLDSERDAYGVAMDKIDQAVVGWDGMKPYQQRDNNMQKSLMLKQFGAELDALAGGGLMESRPALEYEKHILGFVDRTSGDAQTMQTINLQDSTTANRDVLGYTYSRHKEFEGNPLKQRQVAEELLLTLATSLEEAGAIPKEQLADMTKRITGASHTSPATEATRLAVSMASNLDLLDAISRETIEYKSLRASEAVRNLETADIVTATDKSVAFGHSVRGHVTVNQISKHKWDIHPTQMTDAMKEVFVQLDQADEFTKLNPNNEKAINDLLTKFMSNGTSSHGVGYAITKKMDNSAMFINLFPSEQTGSVLDSLRGGVTPNSVIKVPVPLISEQGTMKLGDLVVNANSSVIRDRTLDVYEGGNFKEVGLRKVSAVERLADSFDGYDVSAILKGVHEPSHRASSKKVAARRTHDSMKKQAGTNRFVGGVNDTDVFNNTLADVNKQGYVDIAPGMIHDMFEKELLTYGEKYGNDLNPSAFGKDDKLKTYLDYDEDLTLKMKESISRMGTQWANDRQELLGGESDLAGVKDDRSWNMRSMTDTRRMVPTGDYGQQTRGNVVQMINSYAMGPKLQENMLKAVGKGSASAGLYLNFDELLTTSERRIAESRLPDGMKTHANVKTALMDEAELQDRLKAMHGTAAGRAMLEAEGILNELGEIDGSKAPTVWEQQAVINRDLMASMQLERTKTFNLDLERTLAAGGDLIDEATGGLNVGATVRRGQMIGLDKAGDAVYFRGADSGTLVMNGDRVGVDYKEQAFKFVFDVEKTTASAGGGFSLAFMEALTGVEGVGAIIGPDIEKHKDFHHLFRGHMNRVAEEMKHMPDKRFNESKNFLENFYRTEGNDTLGLKVVRENGSVRIEESLARAGTTEFNATQLNQILGAFGLSEAEEMTDNTYGLQQNSLGETRSTVVLNQAMGAANVSNHSQAVDEGRGNVTYGYREIDMLRRKGMGSIADEIRITQDADALTDYGRDNVSSYQRAMGILTSQKAMAGDIAPGEGDKIWRAEDFRAKPEIDGNRQTYAGTVLDTSFIKEASGYNPGLTQNHGFWFELPEMQEGSEFKLGSEKVSHLFMPYENLEGNGHEVWKSKQHRINESIIERARAVEEAKKIGTNGVVNEVRLKEAREGTRGLQTKISEFNERITYDLTSSNGHVAQQVMKTKMPNSLNAIAKIISPEYTQNTGTNELVISRADARAMGISEILDKGEDFYSPVLRNPTFNDDAIQVAKVRIGEHLLEGQQQISSMMASFLRADSDGDELRSIMMKNKEGADPKKPSIQEQLKKAYQAQDRQHVERLTRIDSSYEKAVKNALNDSDALATIQKDQAGYNEKMADPNARVNYTLDRVAADGTVHLVDRNNAAVMASESSSKFGKQVVGMASNLNYRYTNMAKQYLDMSNLEHVRMRDSIDSFFSGEQGLEQRIISAKHGQDGKVDLGVRHGGLQMIEALQKRDYRAALEIDQDPNLLGSQFTDKAMMAEASQTMQWLDDVAGKEGIREVRMNFGLSSGVQNDYTNREIVDAIEGNTSSNPSGNIFTQQLSGMNGTDSDVAYQYDENALHPNDARAGSENIPERAARNYAERGAGRVSEFLQSSTGGYVGKGLGIAAGVAAGGLMLANMTGADSLKPEDQGHNNEVIDDSNPQFNSTMNTVKGTARVEMRGGNYGGMRVAVSGTAPGNYSNSQIGDLANGALQSSGIQTNINIRSQDDTSSLNHQWVQQQFTDLINNGRAGS